MGACCLIFPLHGILSSPGDGEQETARVCAGSLSATCQSQKGGQPFNCYKQKPLESFLEKEAVPLGLVCHQSGAHSSSVLWTFQLEIGVTPRCQSQARALPFCLLAEDLFAFAIKKMTSVLIFTWNRYRRRYFQGGKNISGSLRTIRFGTKIRLIEPC